MLSESLAIASALCIALGSMFINELKGCLRLLQLARWQMLATFVMTGFMSVVLGGWRTVGAWQFGMLAASGLFGIAIASTTYFGAIYAIGPRLTALLFSLTAPFALVLGYVALGETIDARQALGVALVLCGILCAVGVPRRPRPATPGAGSIAPLRTGSSFWPGVAMGVVTAAGQALGSLCARPAMASGVEPFTAMALRSGLAALFFVALLIVPRWRTEPSSAPHGALTLVVTSAFFGTTLGMSLLLAALRQGDVGIVSTLSSMTPVLILPMVWLRSGVRPTGRAWGGALLALTGTALISLR